MQPIGVMLRSPLDGKSAAYRVIGVLDANNIAAPAAVYTSMAGLERVAGHASLRASTTSSWRREPTRSRPRRL